MTGLHHTTLKTFQMIECAASALAGQQRHRTKTHLYDQGANKAAIHMLSAWAQANRMVLGQVNRRQIQ
jgi:hypothetical protein